MMFADSGTASPAWWITVLAAAIPALAAIGAAVVAGRAAHRARAAEGEASRLRDLEARNDARKYETYKPMVELLSDLINASNPAKGIELPSQADIQQRLARFGTWIMIFGSDDAVRAFGHFQQAAFHDAPGEIYVRVYAEFILAARRDMGYPDTTVNALDFLSSRINDLFDVRTSYEIGSASLQDLAAKHNWSLPWEHIPA